MTKEHLIDFDRKDRIGIPEILYSDSEGSFNSTEFVKFINSNKK